MSFKRHRAQSEASSSSSTSSIRSQPTSKAQRTTPGPEASSSAHPLLCTLPPTCNHNPTPLATAKDLETHYATYHAHVCEEHTCNCVFPEARLLEIHQTECHDPLAAVRRDRGEKIFACHLASCGRMFLTPKARRLHLIQGHGYPKEYYFAVTNKGVGGLLKRWGEGASLMRGQWKPRETTANTKQDTTHARPDVLVEEDDDEDELDANNDGTRAGEGVDSLADSLNSMSLVPPTIRFGRGGKNGGFVHDPHARNPRGGRGQHGRGRGAPRTTGEQGDTPTNPEALAPVPRGGRGRDRGRGAARAAHISEDHDMDVDVGSVPRGGGSAGRGTTHTAEPSTIDVLGYVPRGVRARGLRGAPRGKANANTSGVPEFGRV